jgi:hypothetical protein
MSHKRQTHQAEDAAVQVPARPRRHTAHGERHSSRNSLKHGLCAREILAFASEQERAEIESLYEAFREAYEPANPVEEMLVDRIVSAYYRLSRAIRYELNASQQATRNRLLEENRDNFSALRSDLMKILKQHPKATWCAADAHLFYLRAIRDFHDGVSLNEYSAELRQHLPDEIKRRFGSTPRAEEIGRITLDRELFEAERWEEYCRTFVKGAGLALDMPSQDIIDRVVRHESSLERQLYRAMDQLERLQRQRLGDRIPAPIKVQIS